ncbi:mitochondrial carrier [Trametes coccinea BRFM310]|uniref:Mitochondrial carrier n=1 Tax=Trametes coccinea (strain BRFM310) TaxID=1353009 RepID=A0A1Y2J1S9_TRAC3|nr:mitochondrial carrier [Trametes coccinea BRFM310]
MYTLGESLVFYSSLIFSLAVSLAISVPLTGALVRLRANYNPKALQLDPEGNAHVHTGPIVTSFFGMLRRVYRIEGWAGLYKGLMPTALATVVMTIFAIAALDSRGLASHGRVDTIDTGILGAFLSSAVGMFIALPAAILTYRSIVTPYKLPFFGLMYSLRVLLTPTERRRPWILYLTPGLLATEFLRILYTMVVLRSLRILLLRNFTPFKFGIYLGIEILSVAFTCPLEVMSTKLAIQRNHATTEYNSVEQEVEDDGIEAHEYAEYSNEEEDVIGLRHEKDPYLGFLDCFKRIVDEEGWQTLYRAWWVTMLGAIVSATAAAAQFQGFS